MTATSNSKSRVWNRMAEKYSKQPIADQESYEIKLDISRDYFTAESDVLELGCGTGSTAILHAPFVQHIHGVDISKEMIRIAQAKLGPAGITNVSFEVADVDSYTSNTSYDAVMAMSLIHLVEDREELLARVHSLLKPGGVFISSTVCLGDGWLFRLMSPLFGLMRALGRWPMVKLFTSKRLQSEIEAAGFQIVHHWQPGKNKAVFLIARRKD